jgi:hypothetical protein
MKKVIITASLIVLLVVPFLFGGCDTLAGVPNVTPSVSSVPGGEGFAIYLTKDNIRVSQMGKRAYVELADTPVIARDDIVSYKWETHEILLTETAWIKLQDFRPPTNGISFIVCVDKNPLYWGALWPPYSSQSFDGVTIQVPSMAVAKNVIKIELGYPGSSFYHGEDPRFSPLIKAALENAGNLK